MSISLRNRRAALYTYSDGGSDGLVAPAYIKSPSAASDGNWWASRGVPTGREALVAQQAEHVADSVWCFAGDAPVTENGLIVDVLTGVAFKITAVLPRDMSRSEIQVLALTNTDAVYDTGAAVVVSVDVSPATASLAVNATQQFTATPKDSGGNPITGRAVQWLSGDPAKASITADGLLTALASGTVDVLAIIDGVVGTAVVTIPSGVVDPLGEGNTQFIADWGATPTMFFDRRRNVIGANAKFTAWGDVAGDGSYGGSIIVSAGTPGWDGTKVTTDGATQRLVSTFGIDATQPWTIVMVVGAKNTVKQTGLAVCFGSGFSANQFVALGTLGFLGAGANGAQATSNVVRSTPAVTRLVVSTINVAGPGWTTIEIPGDTKHTSVGGVALTGVLGLILGASLSLGSAAEMEYHALLAFPGGYTPAQFATAHAWAQARFGAQ